MKKFTPFLIVLLLIVAIVTVFTLEKSSNANTIKKSGNTESKPLEFVIGKTQDPKCMMMIRSKVHSAQLTTKSGNTWFFDDIGCLVLWIADKDFKESAKIYTFSKEGKWIDARKAYYVLGAKTPMMFGFTSYESAQKDSVDFKQMSLDIIEGRNMQDPKIHKKYLGN